MNYPFSLSESMPARIDEKTLVLLNDLLGHPVEPQHDSRSNFFRIDLAPAHGAEYFFTLWFHEDGERQISAQLIQDRSDDTYFWCRTLEMAEFGGREHDLLNAFCEELEALLTHETRIVQRKGWIFWHFHCEYRAGETWKSVGSQSAFRGSNFRFPKIEGRKRVYHSAPIASAPRQVGG